ncbi:hypothetical protein PTKIN_Ptkin12aG0003900 [Pterospermum kingtungense]
MRRRPFNLYAYEDLMPKILRIDEEGDETKEKMEETMQETKASLVNVRLSAAQPKHVPNQSFDSKYIKYKPSQQFNSGFPPVQVMHSPPRCLTVKDKQNWTIPPCISNRKKPKGYTIPQDKRPAADGRVTRGSDE